MCKADFIADVIKVFQELAWKGFDKTALLKRIRRFILTFNQKALYEQPPFKIYQEIKDSLKIKHHITSKVQV